jgi:hypothetical protein
MVPQPLAYRFIAAGAYSISASNYQYMSNSGTN